MEIILTADLKREYMIRLAEQFECYCEGVIGREELMVITHNILTEMTEKFDKRAYDYLMGMLLKTAETVYQDYTDQQNEQYNFEEEG